jgi:hypothetical protein
MPNGSAFNVIGGELGLFPNASQPWHDKFQIGDVPDSGDTLSLAFAAVVALFEAAMLLYIPAATSASPLE